MSDRSCRHLGFLAAFVTGFLAGPVLAAPRTLHVTRVQVDKSGLWRFDPNGLMTAEQCGRFSVSATEALRWFHHAREVTRHA